jgi:hypothetical protein
MEARAATLNGLFDEWDQARKGVPVTGGAMMPKYGTVDWLFREYKRSDAFLEKVAERSRGDYEWAIEQICDIRTKTGDRVGGRHVKSITPRAADKCSTRSSSLPQARSWSPASCGCARARNLSGCAERHGV